MTDDADYEQAREGGRSDRGVLGLIASVFATVGTLWIFGLMLLIVADVLGRNAFNHPITGVAEFAAHSVVAIVFLQMSAAVLSRRMTRSDFVTQMLLARAPALAKALGVLFALVGAAIFAAIVYATWPGMVRSWTNSEFFGVQGVFTLPTFPFWALIVFGSAVTVLAYLKVAAVEWRGAGSTNGGAGA